MGEQLGLFGAKNSPAPSAPLRWHIVAGRGETPLRLLLRPRPPLLPYRSGGGPTAVPSLSLNEWLRFRGREDLCAASDAPTPMASRVAELRERGVSEEKVRELLALWEQWRRGRRETLASANARRACLDCGASDAGLYRTRDGRDVRVCDRCLPRWGEFGLQERAPLPSEVCHA